MPLSLDTIHQPLNDFFINKFKTDAGSRVFFRFDKFGSVISDDDFIDPNHPESGYLPALAKEKFSDLVNQIPVDEADGLNIHFSEINQIDEFYFYHLLNPSSPFFPEGIDDQSKETIMNSFNEMKADAKKLWQNIVLESSTGLILDYKPCLATPESWYDKARDELWTRHLFQASETTGAPVDNSPKFQLWKLKIDDAAIQKVLPSDESQPADPVSLYKNVLSVKTIPQAMFIAHTKSNEIIQPTKPTLAAGSLSKLNINIAHELSPAVSVKSFAVHTNYLQQLNMLDIRKRMLVNKYLADNAPTQPVKTSSISISFDYCIVGIDRPWILTAFINDKSWFIPITAKGQLTTSGGLTAMPIGFVAIKNLNIESTNWSAEDIAISKDATDFGPFKVSSEILSSKISHAGIQIIAWLLEKMPDLPPNNSPAP